MEYYNSDGTPISRKNYLESLKHQKYKNDIIQAWKYHVMVREEAINMTYKGCLEFRSDPNKELICGKLRKKVADEYKEMEENIKILEEP